MRLSSGDDSHADPSVTKASVYNSRLYCQYVRFQYCIVLLPNTSVVWIDTNLFPHSQRLVHCSREDVKHIS